MPRSVVALIPVRLLIAGSLHSGSAFIAASFHSQFRYVDYLASLVRHFANTLTPIRYTPSLRDATPHKAKSNAQTLEGCSLRRSVRNQQGSHTARQILKKSRKSNADLTAARRRRSPPTNKSVLARTVLNLPVFLRRQRTPPKKSAGKARALKLVTQGDKKQAFCKRAGGACAHSPQRTGFAPPAVAKRTCLLFSAITPP